MLALSNSHVSPAQSTHQPPIEEYESHERFTHHPCGKSNHRPVDWRRPVSARLTLCQHRREHAHATTKPGDTSWRRPRTPRKRLLPPCIIHPRHSLETFPEP